MANAFGPQTKHEECWRMMLKEEYRLLKLYQLRLKHLETRNEALELVRHILHDNIPDKEKLELVQSYRRTFNNKIQSIRETIDKILSKDEDILEDFMS